MTQENRHKLSYIAMVLLVSTHFAVAYMTSTTPYVSAADLANGVARTPFQYRALTGWVIRFLTDMSVIQEAAKIAPKPFSQPDILVWLLLSCLSMIAMIEIARRTIKLFVTDSYLAATLAFITPLPLYISYVSLASIYRYSYPYDLPSLMLFNLGLLLILKNRIFLFYPVFILATLSRETSVFLIPALITLRCKNLFQWQRQDLLNVLGLSLIWLGLKYWLHSLYNTNLSEFNYISNAEQKLLNGVKFSGGGNYVFQLDQNIQNLLNPIYWPCILSALGWLWAIVIIGWKYLDQPAIKRTLLVITPMVAGGMLLVGRITEVRVFVELTPFFVVAVAIIIRNKLAASGYRTLEP